MQNSEKIWQLVDSHRPEFEGLSDRIWGMPEIAYTEYRSVAEHTAMLKQQGFRVTENLADIPTAVMGEAGQGGPVIAILGEYDALPGLSQVANIAEPKPVEPNGHGHGCGHNLLGSAAMLAATGGQGLACRDRASGPRALLWLPGGGRRRGQGLHGPRRLLRRCRHRHHLAPGLHDPGRRRAVARQHAHGLLTSPAAPRMRPQRRISAAARSTRWS